MRLTRDNAHLWDCLILEVGASFCWLCVVRFGSSLSTLLVQLFGCRRALLGSLDPTGRSQFVGSALLVSGSSVSTLLVQLFGCRCSFLGS